MYSLLPRASLIIFTIIFGVQVLNGSNGTSLLPTMAITVSVQEENNKSFEITHGVASGDITNDSAVVWSRSNREAQMHVGYDISSNFSQPNSLNSTSLANQTTDYTAHAMLEGLKPDTVYYYRVWFSTPDPYQDNSNSSFPSDSLAGTFRTAPDPSAPITKPISFILAADLGGQKHCRQASTGGYFIFKNMKELSPDFFIANGDMIYAADKCPIEGPSDNWKNIAGNFSGIADPDINCTNTEQVRDTYLKHWQYNRADPKLSSKRFDVLSME